MERQSTNMAKYTAEEEREILRQFQELKPPQENFDTEKYAYMAEYVGCNGRYIHQAKVAGWEPIRGDMPENPMLRDVSGYCVMGDVMYMRMPKERFEMFRRAQDAVLRRQLGDTSEEDKRREINEKMSRLVGHSVNMSFEFKDQRTIQDRKRG
jgi:hypothetical protein